MDVSNAYQWRAKFNALADDIFREMGMPSPSLTQNIDDSLTIELMLDGIAFDITHHAENHPERILVACHFGFIPAGQTEAVFRRLLEINLMLARTNDAMFGMIAENNTIVHSFHIMLDATDAAGLLAKIRHIMPQIEQWRQSYFLDTIDSAAPLIVLDKPDLKAPAPTHRQQFLILMDDMCTKLGYPLSDAPDKDELMLNIKLNNVDFSLSHNRLHLPQKFVVECFYGALPDQNQEAVLQRLLELNQEFVEDDRQAFSIDDKSKKVVQIYIGDVSDEDRDDLLIRIVKMSLLAEKWRIGFFNPAPVTNDMISPSMRA